MQMIFFLGGNYLNTVPTTYKINFQSLHNLMQIINTTQSVKHWPPLSVNVIKFADRLVAVKKENTGRYRYLTDATVRSYIILKDT